LARPNALGKILFKIKEQPSSSLFVFNKPVRAMQLEPPAETCLISGEFCNKEATVGTAV